MDSRHVQHPESKDIQELIRRLALYELLDPLCKAEGESAYVSSHKIEDKSLNLSDKNVLDCLCSELGVQDLEQLTDWRNARGLSKIKDLTSFAREAYKKKEVIADLLKGCGESLFLRYKDRLDRVLYSLIRVESAEQAHDLYYSIEANEIEFGDAAAQYSTGPESKTQGIIGPVDLTTPHPEIAARLRTATPRQLFPPFQADQWYAVIRLEYRFDSEYDEKTRLFLGSLLLSAKSQDLIKKIKSSYISNKNGAQ